MHFYDSFFIIHIFSHFTTFALLHLNIKILDNTFLNTLYSNRNTLDSAYNDHILDCFLGLYNRLSFFLLIAIREAELDLSHILQFHFTILYHNEFITFINDVPYKRNPLYMSFKLEGNYQNGFMNKIIYLYNSFLIFKSFFHHDLHESKLKVISNLIYFYILYQTFNFDGK